MLNSLLARNSFSGFRSKSFFLLVIIASSGLSSTAWGTPATNPETIPTNTPATPVAANATLEFDQLLQKSKESNVEYIQRKADRDASAAALEATRSQFLPRVGVEARYESFESNIEKEDGPSANAYIEWNVFNGFRNKAESESARIKLKQSEHALSRSEMNLRNRLLALYSRSQTLQKTTDAYRTAIADNEVYLTSVKARKRAGLVSDSDLLEFELYGNKLKLELSEFEGEYELSLGDLKGLSGIQNIGSLTTTLKPRKLKLTVSDLDNLLNSANSELHHYQDDLIEAEIEVRAAKSGYYPKLDLKATHGSEGRREANQDPETTVAVTAKWELFSGFETSASKNVSEAKVIQAQANLSVARVTLKTQAEQLLKKINTLVDRLALEEENSRKTQAYLKAVEQEYRRGVKNSADLKNATEILLQSQIKGFELTADYYQARSDLQYILGVELEEANP